MASNPIKRRARQSFFLGFLIALVVMAIVVMLLFTKINSLNEENEKLKILGPKVSVYTVNKDIEEGEAITVDDLVASTMQLSQNSKAIDVENYIDPSIFYGVDEDTEEEIELSYTSKVQIPAGSVVTLSMLQQVDVVPDERLMEYNMIVLPSQLKNGDYIDIRLRLPDGEERVVIPKKKVDQCTVNSIWVKMDEMEITHMNCAIVDAYLTPGSQLRATVYTDPLMQTAAEMTYPVPREILTYIAGNPNILPDAANELYQKWTDSRYADGDNTFFDTGRNIIDSYINSAGLSNADKAETVGAGYDQEATDINTARGEFVTALEGTGLVGTTTE